MKRDDRFGYIELPPYMSLRDAIDFEDETIYNEFSEKNKYTTSRLKIARANHYELRNEDYTINKYFNENLHNDLFREIKDEGFDKFVKDIDRYVKWCAEYRPEHIFSEDEMKFIEMMRQAQADT